MTASFIPSLLKELDDITITTPAVGHGIRYDGSKWINQQLSHLDLTNVGVNTHVQIDTHISTTTNPHGVTLTQNSITLTGGILTTPNDNLTISSSLYNIYLRSGGSLWVIIDTGSGLLVLNKVGIGTASPTLSGTGKLHMAANTFRLDTARTPASAGATGNAGEICWDANYIYVCVATDTWRRASHSTWV